MAELVHINGSESPIVAPGETDPALIEKLEYLLKIAREGELEGFAVTGLLVSSRSYVDWHFNGRDHGMRRLQGAIASLSYKYAKHVEGD